MNPIVAALDELADRVAAGLSFDTFWGRLHVICSPDDAGTGYGERLGQLFEALRAATGVTHHQYLSAVLRARHREGTLPDVLRQAARRLR